MSSTFFHKQFHELLLETGVPGDEASQYTSHSLRQGVAADILERHGLQAMLEYGQWATPQAASHYTSWDEIDRQTLGQIAADLSEDEI